MNESVSLILILQVIYKRREKVYRTKKSYFIIENVFMQKKIMNFKKNFIRTDTVQIPKIQTHHEKADKILFFSCVL